MRTLALKENGPPGRHLLSTAEAAALAATALAVVHPTVEPGRWTVAPNRKVGAVAIGDDLQVVVAPKLPVERLVFLLGYAADPHFWREDDAHLERTVDLPEALAETFARLSAHAVATGLLHGYRTMEDSLPVVRGRIRADDQLRVRFGMALPIEVRYDDFTTDIAENRLLLAATLALLRTPRLPVELRHRLLRLRVLLADVTPPTLGTAVPRWTPSRLNARYQPALRIAEVVLGLESFEHRAGDLRVTGYVLDMWMVFEEFLSVALHEATRGAPVVLRTQLPGRSLDERRRVPVRPDLAWVRDGAVVAVADAKYKRTMDSRFPNADLYQLLAYCTVLGLEEGHLVYAAGDDEPVVHHVVNSRVLIHCHALDLDQAPRDLLADVAGMASRMLEPVGVT